MFPFSGSSTTLRAIMEKTEKLTLYAIMEKTVIEPFHDYLNTVSTSIQFTKE